MTSFKIQISERLNIQVLFITILNHYLIFHHITLAERKKDEKYRHSRESNLGQSVYQTDVLAGGLAGDYIVAT